MTEDYRQKLRDEISKRKFAHRHFSEKQIAQARLARRKQLEGEISEHKEELEQTKPENGIISTVKNLFWRRKQ